MPVESELQSVLAALAAAAGVPAPRRAESGRAAPWDLADPDTLVDLVAPELLASLRRAVPGPASPAGLATQVAALAGRAPAALFGDEAQAVAALVAAVGAPGRGPLVAVDPVRLTGAPARRAAVGDAATAAVAGAAAVVIEPSCGPDLVAAWQAAARAAGVPFVLDERRTAFRLAPTTVAATLPQPPDFVLLGSAVAGGLPFGALVGSAAPATVDAATAAVVATVIEHLAATPIDALHTDRGRELIAAVTAAAAQHEVLAAFEGPPAMPQLVFADQEGASSALIGQHFAAELLAAGCRVDGPLLLPASVLRDGVAGPARAFAHALGRARTLLIEFNSHLSGGLPFVWPGGDDRLRARGATFYRYPRLAAVEVGPQDGAMRIAFAGGPLGAVTSSGFYLPTRLCGDVDVAVRFVLHRFAAGPDATCLGLFLQNEASTARYYAQVSSHADAPQERRVALGHAGALLGRRRIDGDAGWLRLVRRGGAVHAYHRPDAASAWQLLGSVPATADDLVVGAKIWSKVATDGIVADLHDLAVDAEPAADQPPLLEPRPDPRRANQ